MDLIDAETLHRLGFIWTQVLIFISDLVLPSRLIQIAILIVLWIVAHGLGGVWLSRKLDAWARKRQLSAAQLRHVISLRQRLRGLVFVVLAWGATWVLAEMSPFTSRRFIVEFVATVATAWIVIGLVVRLIRNPLMRRMVSWALWIGATLHYLGVLDDASQILDSIAVEFGSFRLSALAVTKAVIVTTAMLTVARVVAGQASSSIRHNDEISPSMKELIIKVLQVVLFGLAMYVGLKSVGFDLTGLAVLSGAIGVGLGFGLQKVVSNLVSGVIILLDKSIKPGDVISLGDTFGWINSLGARYVSVVTRDGKEYLIPNEDLITGQVVNWSHSDEYVRIDLFFGTAYSDDPHVVRDLAVKAAQSVERVLKDRKTVCHIVGFGDSSVDYILRFWITDPVEGLTNVRGGVYLALWDTFKANGISIPFPQREVTMLGGSQLAVHDSKEKTVSES
ncbi:mechanosensitive ion channel protein [Thioclava sp. SK-1]|uniref:mechanosensitive ion channel family protein n=1 Tax=Thioclava sp. SK-1 TaxID=1889770 RepID=UPI000826334E|nr:mechanosensitive ion channel domain-containing protein [Thioclava sp. SK-1]OCX65317.1 mechanosensitive ion channel protein [Thioclava sp. SK-1]